MLGVGCSHESAIRSDLEMIPHRHQRVVDKVLELPCRADERRMRDQASSFPMTCPRRAFPRWRPAPAADKERTTRLAPAAKTLRRVRPHRLRDCG